MINMNRFDSDIPIIDTENYFDAIRINFYLYKDYVQSLLDTIVERKILEKNHEYSFIDTRERIPDREKPLEKLWRSGIKAQMWIVSANPEKLAYLNDLHTLLLKDEKDSGGEIGGPRYKISYIEIARDFIVENMDDAKDLSVALYRDTNMSRMSLKDGTEYEMIKGGKVNKSNFKYGIDIKRSIPGAATYSTGGKSIYHTGYARISKSSSRLCCHGEFKIQGAPNINEKTGIRIFPDLLDFDIKDFYMKTADEYFYRCEINMIALGKWILSLDSRTKLSQKKEKECIKQAQLWRHAHKVGNYSDLIQEILKVREELKSGKFKSRKLKKRYDSANLSKFRTILPETRIQRKPKTGFVPFN